MPIQFVEPSVYFTGFTAVNEKELIRYLKDSDNSDFMESYLEARKTGLSPAECLCSMYAKLCYNALSVGKNANVSRVRDIQSNLEACFDHGHGSVFEHANFSFVIRNCSRVFTHELVRHRIGTAFSQTSGRYCRPVPNKHGSPEIGFVHDPILDSVKGDIELTMMELLDSYQYMVDKMDVDKLGFEEKKKVTSALRRILPNGQSNEIAVSFNIRAIRHMVMMRTSRHAEWEIRKVFSDVYKAIKEDYPMVFYGAKETEVNGILEITGMNMQPYQPDLSSYNNAELASELMKRGVQVDRTWAASNT